MAISEEIGFIFEYSRSGRVDRVSIVFEFRGLLYCTSTALDMGSGITRAHVSVRVRNKIQLLLRGLLTELGLG